MSYQMIAVEVLKAAGCPLHYKVITDRAIKEGLLVTKGLTPASTMGAILGSDINKKGVDSLFVRAEKKGEFGLANFADPGETKPKKTRTKKHKSK